MNTVHENIKFLHKKNHLFFAISFTLLNAESKKRNAQN